jgi:hypothetical protein
MKFLSILIITFHVILSHAVIKLNQPSFAQDGNVTRFDFVIVNGQEHVVFIGDWQGFDFDQLFSVPVTGGTNTNLGQIDFFSDVFNFQITPDHSRVIFSADRDVDDTAELYSVSPLGGPSVKLNPDFAMQDVESDFQITADSKRVVYRANQDNLNQIELFSADISMGGASSIKLNVPLIPNSNITLFKVSPSTNNHVIYTAQQNNSLELFSIPADGNVPNTKICPDLAPGNFINTFEISPDGNRVVYAALQNDPQLELYSTPINSNAGNIRLSPDLNVGEFVVDFRITPNSSNVVYRARQDGSTQIEIYSTSILGNAVIHKLCVNLIPGEGITDFQISPDSSQVVYRAQIGSPQVELFSFPVNPLEEPVKKVCPNLDPGENVFSYKITPDSKRVVYIANQDSAQTELFVSPITNNAPNLKLSPNLNANQNVVDPFFIHSDSHRIFYLANFHNTNKNELFVVPITGGISHKLNDPLQSNGDVSATLIPSPFFSPSQNHIVYNADQDTDQTLEIYSVNIQHPIITSSTNITTFVGTNFSYTITASQGPILAFGASNLPNWATLNDNTITGIPDVVSTNFITLFATNSVGSGSALMRLVVLPTNGINTNLPLPLPPGTNDIDQVSTGFTGDFDGDEKIDLLAQKKRKVTLISLRTNGVDNSKSLALEKGQKVRAANRFSNTNALVLQKGTEISALLVNSNFAPLGVQKLGVVSNKKIKVKASGDLNGDGQPDILTQQGKTIGALLSPNYQFFNLLSLEKNRIKAVGIIAADGSTNSSTTALLFSRGKQLYSCHVPTNTISLSQPQETYSLDRRYQIRGAIRGSNSIKSHLILTQKKNVGLVTYGTKNLGEPVFKTTKKIGKIVGSR